jgi:ribosomal protein S18 acetylase RimI-like enzyme
LGRGSSQRAPLEPELDEEAIASFLERDPGWAAYLLADLCAPMREHTRYFMHRDEALVCLHQPPEWSVVSSMGAAAGVAALLDAAPLPTPTALVAELGHRDVLEARYRASSWDRMVRMALPSPPGPAAPSDARLLSLPDLPALASLLARREGFAPFTAEMLRHGVYAGVRAGGELVAVAGTHVVAAERGVAALGNVFTAPEARGRGLARAATAAVIEELVARGCDRVVLNVAADNEAALRLYRRLGFVTACEFWEVPEATRR